MRRQVLTPAAGLHLIGAIRVVADVDSIGVAVLQSPGGNTMYVPEMDGDLRTTKFIPFTNEGRYEIDYNVSRAVSAQQVYVGEPAPLPFWVEGVCQAIPGDAEPEDIARMFGRQAGEHSVLLDMRKLLKDARAGVFRLREERWTTQDFVDLFSDIFHGTPVHSRYWVSRYNVALARARTIAPPPHPIDSQLRRVAIDWFSRFSTKTDFHRMVTMLGQPSNGVITHERACVTMFGYLVHKLQSGNFRMIEGQIKHPLIAELFPDGIYYFYQQRGWPKAVFNYARDQNLNSIIGYEILMGDKARDFTGAERMAYLLYQKMNAPDEVNDLVIPIFNNYLETLNLAIRGSEYIFSDRKQRYRWSETADELLSCYKICMTLDGIMNGDSRLSKQIINGRFGIWTRQIKRWRQFFDSKDN